jgi:DNA-binding PadR family transcriptional regulator
MSLKHGLLGLLRYGSMTGYDLDKIFKSHLKSFWYAQTSQIYRELNKMEDNKWLSSEIVFQEGKPNKKVYSITDLGNDEFIKWLTDVEQNDAIEVKQTFLMKMFFSADNDISITLKILEDFKESCQQRMQSLKVFVEDFDNPNTEKDPRKEANYWVATAEFGTMFHNMCIEWADKTIQRIKNLD